MPSYRVHYTYKSNKKLLTSDISLAAATAQEAVEKAYQNFKERRIHVFAVEQAVTNWKQPKERA